MKRIVCLVVLLSLCLLLGACGGCDHTWQQSDCEAPRTCVKCGKTENSTEPHMFTDWVDIVPACGGQTGQSIRVCAVCSHQESRSVSPAPLHDGTLFTLTPAQFHDRLEAIGAAVSLDFSARLEVSDWAVASYLEYQGELFMVVTYFQAGEDYPEPVTDPNSATVGRLVVMDYLDANHAPNAFAAVLMTVDPFLTESDTAPIHEALASNHAQYFHEDVILEKNGLGYGYSFYQDQTAHSGSVSIRPSSGNVNLCIHQPEGSTRGLPEGVCTLCGNYVLPPENWIALTDCSLSENSNEPGSNTDVALGDWTDFSGNTYPESLKFWVIDRPGWSNTESIGYLPGSGYHTLSCVIAPAKNSDASSEMWFNIYLDGELAYTSNRVSGDMTDAFRLNITDVRLVKVECVTDSPGDGHCIFSASLY